jgi:hypothetical protein
MEQLSNKADKPDYLKAIFEKLQAIEDSISMIAREIARCHFAGENQPVVCG